MSSGPTSGWVPAFARIPVLVNAGLLVFCATVLPALPPQLIHHSSGKCWASWISVVAFPGAAVALALAGSALIRFAPRGRELSLATDFAAWASSSVALYSLLSHLAGYRCI